MRYVTYRYAISLVFVTFYNESPLVKVPPGKSRILAGWRYLLITLLLGWWGIPWGPIRTLQALSVNLSGGEDLTLELGDTVERIEETRPRLHRCQHCLSPLPDNAELCPACGFSLTGGL